MQAVEAWFIRNEDSAKGCNQSYPFIQYFGKVSVCADHAWAEEVAGTVRELSSGCLPNHTVQDFRLPHWTRVSLLFSLSPNTIYPSTLSQGSNPQFKYEQQFLIKAFQGPSVFCSLSL